MSNVEIVQGTNDKPGASASLIKLFTESTTLDGIVYIGFPVLTTGEGRQAVDALYVSPTHGVTVIDLVESDDFGDYQQRQDDSINAIYSRLINQRSLRRRQTLLVALQAATFAPASASLAGGTYDPEYPVVSAATIENFLHSSVWSNADEQLYRSTLSVLQNISTLRRTVSARHVQSESSKGAALQRLESSIATLDIQQGRAVIETVEGVQRIRGLAGSGKTIVLALKAAYLHATHPDWDIAVTFNTRSLREQFVRLINNFSVAQAGVEPDWRKLRVIHAWGASGGGTREGIYHQFCRINGTSYLDFGHAKEQFGYAGAFKGACATALSEAEQIYQVYDAILVDEAQDLPAEFLRLCYFSLREPRRLVYAYDELQNLGNLGMPSTEEIFGRYRDGSPVVSFEDSYSAQAARKDVILEMCYRNSRPILTSAHALGFGVYREQAASGATSLVQIFDDPDLWGEIGYRVKRGSLTAGHEVALERTPETSPPFLEEIAGGESPVIEFFSFESQGAQADWVAAEIEKNLTVDELSYNDIIVINPDPYMTRKNLGPLRARLLAKEIQSHVAGVDSTADVFFDSTRDSITCTGIYRAKGNEAGMVYVLDADECYNGDKNLARRRNMLFTAITRSKAWVRVLGIGAQMDRLAQEFAAVRSKDWELQFRYPTDAEREEIQIVHRDLSKEDEEVLRSQQSSLASLVSELESGRVYLQDLDQETLARLSSLLQDRDK